MSFNTAPQTSDNPDDQVNQAPLALALAPLPQGADPDVTTAQKAVAQAETNVQKAQQDYQNAASAYQTVIGQKPSAADNGEYAAKVNAAGRQVDAALQGLSAARTQATQAYTKLSDASTAAAAHARTPEQNAYYQQHANQAAAGAALYQAQADSTKAKTQSEIDKNKADTQDALARAQSLNILSPAQATQALAGADHERATADQIRALTQPQVDNTQANTSKTNAETGTLIPSQANQNNASANQANAAATEAGARTSTLIPAQANQANAGANASNAAATEANAQATVGIPAQANQANAAAAASNATVQKGLLGNLYGLNDQIKAISDGIRQGSIPADQAGPMLQQYIQSTVAGTDIYHATQDAEKAIQARTDQQITQRGQDATLAASKANDLTSFAGNSLGTFQTMNRDTPAGSDAGGRAFLASLALQNQALQQPYLSAPSPVASPPLPSFLQSFANPATAAPAAAPGGGHTIQINIGGTGAPATPTPMPAPMPAPQPVAAPAPVAPTPVDVPQNPSADSIIAGLQANGGQFASSAPAPAPDVSSSPTDGSDQSGIPMMAHGGIVTRPTVAMIGEKGPEAVVPLSHAAQMPAILQAHAPATVADVIRMYPAAAQRAGLVRQTA